MASASVPLHVKCGFCSRRDEELDDPRLLPCEHIHCSKCLNRALESKNCITCPDCKKVIYESVRKLPVANISSQRSTHKCDKCKTKAAAFYCEYESCKKALCIEDEKYHNGTYPYHSTISIEEYSRLSRKHEKRVCSRHNQPLVFGCRKCSQILCEDCDEPANCLGARHQMTTIKTLFKEAKQEVEPYRAKAEKRKDELSAILKESERVLSTYREETQEILELVKSTRDEQIRVLKDKYEQLTREITKRRKVTAEEIVKFRDEVVEEELSQLNMSLQRVVATPNNDHMVDLVQNCKKTKDEISSAVRKELPGLSIEKGVGLMVKGDRADINAEIAAAHDNIFIGQPLHDRRGQQREEMVAKSSPFTESAGQSSNMSDQDKRSKAATVEEDFDKIYYEFMTIIRKRDFQTRILEKYGGQLLEKEHPTDSRVTRIRITSHTPGEAAKMMDALNEMFYEINRSVHSHSTKLLYDGDKDKLALSLIKDIRDPSRGFIARLVTKEDIRIIGSIANMDRDVSIVESYIGEYKKKYPAAPVTKVTQSDIALPNGTVVTVMEGDLTKMKSEAVVSSSGPDLAHKHGVSRAIAQACGQRFCAKGRRFIETVGELKDGDTFVQPADGRMLINGVRYIIHAIAPLPCELSETKALLVRTVNNALKEAEQVNCRTVALPAICSGSMGVPLQTCAECYWTALVKYSTENPLPKIKQILFVVDDPVIVLQIHQVMSSMSLDGSAVSSGGTAASYGSTAASYGSTAASYGGAAASYGGTAASLGGQEIASDQRKGSSGRTGGRVRTEIAMEVDDCGEGLADERGRHSYGMKGTKHAATDTRQTPSSVDVVNRAAGLASVSASTPYGGSSASTRGSFNDQQEGWREAERNRTLYSSDHTRADLKNYTSNASVSGQRGAGYRGDPSIPEVHGHAGSSVNYHRTKNSYLPRAGAATPTSSTYNSKGSAAAGTTKPNDNECPICMDDFKDPVTLPCSHKFCKDCVDQVVKTAKSNLCPTCRSPFKNAEGKQPTGGSMHTHSSSTSLPGYPRHGTITISYSIPGGRQGPEHPNPGQHYTGTSRTAYLPDNTKGRRAEKLLRKAFNQRLVFTIGQSVTTGLDNCVVWNDIHHKTNISGGPSNYGYPDPDYLDRLTEDLRAKGITD